MPLISRLENGFSTGRAYSFSKKTKDLHHRPIIKMYLSFMFFRLTFALLSFLIAGICIPNTLALAQQPGICGLGNFVPFPDSSIEMEDNIANWIRASATQRQLPRITLPVVVHIVYNRPTENVSDEQVISQISILNQGFAGDFIAPVSTPDWIKGLKTNSGISFCLADKDPDGNPSTGITRTFTNVFAIGLKRDNQDKLMLFYDELGGKTPWPVERYINIYVCAMGPNIAGYAILPNSEGPKQEDGLVINHLYFGINTTLDYNLGRVACHEMGHYLNLLHPWGRGGCTDDDRVADTPQQDEPYFGCPNHPQISCGSRDLVYNTMDYASDSCAFMFTPGQILRMQASISLYRTGLIDGICSQESENPGAAFTVYPNPFSAGPLIIRWLEKESQPERIYLFSSDGRLVSQTIFNPSGVYTFEVTHLPPGLYTLWIQTGMKTHYAKIVKSQ
jgi:hypothetical protein